MLLNDKTIRPRFIEYLSNTHNKPQKVIEELPVCFGNAIADIVSIDKYLHCYEIKGETDCISRINHQSKFYNQAFKKISLITTSNHVKYALSSIPQYWGLILVTQKGDTISFKQIRKAKNNPDFSKEEALHTLWKDELISIAEKERIQVSSKMNKRILSNIVSSSLNKTYIIGYISALVSARY